MWPSWRARVCYFFLKLDFVPDYAPYTCSRCCYHNVLGLYRMQTTSSMMVKPSDLRLIASCTGQDYFDSHREPDLEPPPLRLFVSCADQKHFDSNRGAGLETPHRGQRADYH